MPKPVVMQTSTSPYSQTSALQCADFSPTSPYYQASAAPPQPYSKSTGGALSLGPLKSRPLKPGQPQPADTDTRTLKLQSISGLKPPPRRSSSAWGPEPQRSYTGSRLSLGNSGGLQLGDQRCCSCNEGPVTDAWMFQCAIPRCRHYFHNDPACSVSQIFCSHCVLSDGCAGSPVPQGPGAWRGSKETA
jgi:hypothetical protein